MLVEVLWAAMDSAPATPSPPSPLLFTYDILYSPSSLAPSSFPLSMPSSHQLSLLVCIYKRCLVLYVYTLCRLY